MNNNPSISIVIPSYNSKQTINECLNSVLNQSYQGIQEVIVVDSSDDGTDEMVRDIFPNVKLIHLKKRTLPGAARNVGVGATHSEYIAFTDTDCIADYDWVENLMRRMVETNCDALGGSIINGTPESISGTLGYLSEFSFFFPQRRSGFAKRLATANVCYRRYIFNKYKFIETHFAGEDTAFHWTIINNGGKLFFDQTAKVTHKNRKGFINVLKHQHKLGEGAGVARIIMKTDLFLVKFPIISIVIIPWYRVLRTHRRVYLTNKKLWKKTIIYFPLSLLLSASWSLGLFQSLLNHKDM